MNDEELYVLATQELNSNQRREDLWARAIALASDDHDEARYLYTNLRVEELAAERHSTQSQAAQSPANGPDSTNPPSSVPGNAATSKIPDDEVLKLEDLPDITEQRDPDLAAAEHRVDRSIYDQTQSNDIATHTDSNNEVNENPTDNIDGPAASHRITNQMGLYVDDLGDENVDPLDRTEPDGFASADNSMELTAPENLPPVQLDAEEPGVETPMSVTSVQEHAQEHSEPVAVSNPVQDSTVDSDENFATELTFGRAYSVLQHTDGSRKAVKIGNSWPALLVTLPWLLYKKLWGTALVYLIMAVLLIGAIVVTGMSLFDAGTDASTPQKLIFAAFLLLAFFGMIYIPFRQGNHWAVKHLQRKGFMHSNDINAQSAKDALDLSRH